MPAGPQDPERITLRKKKKRFSFFKSLFYGCFILLFLSVLIGSVGIAYIYFEYSKDLPDVRVLKDFKPDLITRMYSDSDDLIAEFYIEKRILVPLEKIPVRLKQATLAVEDSNFYSHFGIDPKAIFRAFLTNLKAGHVVEGGSTITQQLAKTLFLSRAKNIERKIREAIISVRLEMIFSKDEILEMYLNQIYYGHGAYGVEGAAQSYFGKHVWELNLEECAMIAGLPKAPNNYSPYRYPDRAKIRRNHSIRRMATLNYISTEETVRALKSEIKLKGIRDPLNKAPYFVEHVRQFLQDKFGSTKLYRDGLKVYTTLNLNNQIFAQNAVKHHLRVADKRYGYRGPLEHLPFPMDEAAIQLYVEELNQEENEGRVIEGTTMKGLVTRVSDIDAHVHLGRGQGLILLQDMDWARKPNIYVDGKWAKIKNPSHALSEGDVILVKVLGFRSDGLWALALEQDPEVQAGIISLDTEGSIKAMVGGYDFDKSQFNRAVQAIRQPGSAFKPLIFASAIAEGFTPASIIIDSPVIFKEKEDNFDKWKPVNFEEKFYGPTPLRTALAHSRNVVTIKLLQSIGIKNAIQMVRRFGITSHLEENLSIALGSSGVTLLELTTAYSVIANLGVLKQPTGIRYIQDRNGNIIFEPEDGRLEVVPSGVAAIVTSLMQSVVQEGTGRKVKVLNRPVAGKTGTTNNYIDAWFMGFTPELITGVWVGKDKDEPLGINETGSRTAIPIWLEYMQNSMQGLPVKNFPVSPEITYYKINAESGLEADFDDHNSKFEMFLNTNPPAKEAETTAAELANNY